MTELLLKKDEFREETISYGRSHIGTAFYIMIYVSGVELNLIFYSDPPLSTPSNLNSTQSKSGFYRMYIIPLLITLSSIAHSYDGELIHNCHASDSTNYKTNKPENNSVVCLGQRYIDPRKPHKP